MIELEESHLVMSKGVLFIPVFIYVRDLNRFVETSRR